MKEKARLISGSDLRRVSFLNAPERVDMSTMKETKLSLGQVAYGLIQAEEQHGMQHLVDTFEAHAHTLDTSVEEVAHDAYMLLVRFGAFDTAKRVKEHFDLD